MSDAGPPSRSYEQPRRYEIPERFRPAPRRDEDAERTVSGPTAARAAAPTEPVTLPVEAPPRTAQQPRDLPGRPRTQPAGPPPRRGSGPGGPGRPGGPSGLGPGRPGGPPPPSTGQGRQRPDTKIVLLAIAVVVVVVGAALGAYLALSGGDDKSPGGTSDATVTRQTADKIYTALNAHDQATLMSLSCNPRMVVLGSIAGTLASVRNAHETSGQKVSGPDATSTGMMLVSDSADPAARQTEISFQLHLHKNGSHWCTAGFAASKYTPAAPAPASSANPSSSPTASTASTAEPAGTPPCAAVMDLPAVAHLILQPAATEEAPESFVPPTAGRRVATCVSHYRGSGHLARVVVWAGSLMQQYVSQLKQLQWQVVSASPTTPVLQNGVGVRVTVVSGHNALVILVDNGH